jgi:hypothetical protein
MMMMRMLEMSGSHTKTGGEQYRWKQVAYMANRCQAHTPRGEIKSTGSTLKLELLVEEPDMN